MGICEVDLRRDENNDGTSRNIFSTEQVINELSIEGYKLILPNSWDVYNRARVIVYAKNDINTKKIIPKNEDIHIQNILLEVGYEMDLMCN